MDTIAIREKKVDTKPSSPIKAVHTFSSGWAEQHKEHRYGTRKPQMWWVLTSQSWIRIPLNYFLIEHRDGLVLFDTGLDPAIETDANYIDSVIGRFLLPRIFKLHINIEDRLDRVLAKSGFSANDIQTALMVLTMSSVIVRSDGRLRLPTMQLLQRLVGRRFRPRLKHS